MNFNLTRTQRIILAVFVVFIIALTIFIPLSINLVNHFSIASTNFNIQNLNTYTNPPASEVKNLYSQLHTTITQNFNLPSDIKIEDANIRKNTFSTITEDDTITDTFILDIPSIEQSFSIKFTWSNSSEFISDGVNISCVAKPDMIYDNYCQVPESDTITATIDHFIPHSRSIDLTYPYTITISLDENNHTFLSAQIFNCEKEDIGQLVKTDILNWLDSLNLSNYTNNLEINTICMDTDA